MSGEEVFQAAWLVAVAAIFAGYAWRELHGWRAGE